jgi:putative sterol carrier protein
MAIMFPTQEWIAALMIEINRSKAYREAASTWEGDFYFVVEPEGNFREKVILYMDLWHGECRNASLIHNDDNKTPEFTISAPLSRWRKIIEKKLDPIQGLVTRQLILKGNLMKIMKVPKAALELVNCCTLVPTAFPNI